MVYYKFFLYIIFFQPGMVLFQKILFLLSGNTKYKKVTRYQLSCWRVIKEKPLEVMDNCIYQSFIDYKQPDKYTK